MLKVRVQLSLLELMLVVQLLEQDGLPSALKVAASLNAAAIKALRASEKSEQTSGSSVPSEAGA